MGNIPVAEIRNWLKRGQAQNARWMMICHDPFGVADYPAYVMAHEDPRKRITQLTTKGLAGAVHEVYDLNLDLDSQLREQQSWHLPPALMN